MKVVKTLILILILIEVGNTQDCYVHLGDITGINSPSDSIELENMACELRLSFPVEFQSQFKVFGFGFGNIIDYTIDGSNKIWNKVIKDVKLKSPYYLILGRQLLKNKDGSKIWIELNLPQIENSPCNGKEIFIKNKLNSIFNPVKYAFDFTRSEIDAMKLIITLKKCEICNNDIDDDGDGYIDCDDLDCPVEEFSESETRNGNKLRSTNCSLSTLNEADCLIDNYEYFNQIQIYDTKSAVKFCNEINDIIDSPTKEIEEIDNGIQISDIYVPSTELVPGRLIGYTRYRFLHNPPNHPAPDLDYGTDGDSSIISWACSGTLTASNINNENSMRTLLHQASNADYEVVADKFMSKFINSEGGFYEDDDISDLIKETNEFKNKAKMFGQDLELNLNNVHGKIEKVKTLSLALGRRYVFSRHKGYLWEGPTILINDVSQVNYYLQDYSVDNSGNWEGTFYVEVIDHFGLDDNDPNNEIPISDNIVATYQFLSCGFASWWVLQHQRAYKPFRTKLRIIFTLNGKLNI